MGETTKMPVGNGFREQSANTSFLLHGDDSMCNAHELISDKYHDIMAACGKFDSALTGKVSQSDLRRILYNEVRVFPSHMDQIMTTVTTDSRGDVCYSEWLSNFSRNMRTQLSSRQSGASVNSLQQRIADRLDQRSGTHKESLKADHLPIRSNTLRARGPSGTTHVPSIEDVMSGRRSSAQIHVGAVREMQLVDEIRALRLPVEQQMAFLRDLPVSTDKKIDYFRELQKTSNSESKQVTDLQVTDYLRSTAGVGNPLRQNAEKVLQGAPQRELSLIGEVSRMPLTNASKISLLRDLPASASKKLDLVHEFRCSEYVDGLKKNRPIAF